MSLDNGYIKLWRDLLKKPIWIKSTPEQRSVLIAILLAANHSTTEWEWMGEKFKVNPGQFVSSLESIRSKSGKGISTQNVRSSLKRFQKLEFLTDYPTKTGRLITIINWGSYQPEKINPTKEATKTQQRPNKDPTPNKNDKNNNNEINKEPPLPPKPKKPKKPKKIFIPPTKEEVISFFIDNGYDGNKGANAFDFYAEADWVDSRGNKVKNWKQKMRGVWFKDENKIMKINGQQGMTNAERWVQSRMERENG